MLDFYGGTIILKGIVVPTCINCDFLFETYIRRGRNDLRDASNRVKFGFLYFLKIEMTKLEYRQHFTHVQTAGVHGYKEVMLFAYEKLLLICSFP